MDKYIIINHVSMYLCMYVWMYVYMYVCILSSTCWYLFIILKIVVNSMKIILICQINICRHVKTTFTMTEESIQHI